VESIYPHCKIRGCQNVLVSSTRFDTVPACDRRTDGQTHDDSIYRASIASRGKNTCPNGATVSQHVDFVCRPARSCSDDTVIRFVLPVLWMTSRFHVIGACYIDK